jgi:hypothetical protein
MAYNPDSPGNVGEKVIDGRRQPVSGYQQITGLSSVKTLTVPTGATLAFILAESQAVRWTDDGSTPSASVGMPLAVGVPFMYCGDLAALKFFEQAASATVNVSYYL